MVGTDYPYSNFLPRKGAVIQIDERAMALGRRAPTAFGAVGSARPTLKLLLGQVAPKSDTSFWERVTKERREWMRCWTSKPIRRAARIASIRRLWPAR
jgi:pyruvate dehydrogenase (quinone)